MTPASFRGDADPNLFSFRRWIRTLNWDDLQSAMSFRVRNSKNDSTDDSSKSMGIQPHLRRASPRDELDLLAQMVQLQRPLPTPIHPRAIPYVPASELGRGYVESTYNSPISKPLRWLRFIGHVDASEAERFAVAPSNKGHHRPTKTNRANHPRRKKDYGNGCISSLLSVDVLARQFRSMDGTALATEGMTLQQDADYCLLRGTTLLYMDQTADDDPSSVVLCRFDRSVVTRRFHTPQDLIRLLQWTSRGNFATRAVLDCKMEDSQSKALYPPWFDPLDRWFPLSMYLAARFEVSLWKAFYLQNTPISAMKVEREALSSRRPSIWDDYKSDSTLETLLLMSVVESLKDFLHQEKQKLNPSRSFYIRDCLFWEGVLHDFVTQSSEPSLFKRYRASDLLVCPLLEMDSKAEGLRQQIRKRFQRLQTDFFMQLLLQEDTGGAVSDETKAASNITKKAAPSSKRHLGKKKKKAVSCMGTKDSSIVSNLLTSVDQSDVDSSSSSDNAEFEARSRVVRKPDNNASARVRSKHTLLVLSVIDDVISNVFQQVGLVSIDEDDLNRSFCQSESKQSSTETAPDEKKIVSNGSEHENPHASIAFPEQTLDNLARPSITTSTEEWHFDHDRIFTPLVHHTDGESAFHRFPFYQNTNILSVDPTATIRTSNLQGFSSIGHASFSTQFFNHQGKFEEGAWDAPGYATTDSFNRYRSFDRNESIFTDFFHSQSTDQALLASSTAASIASSDKGYDGDSQSAPEVNELDFVDYTVLDDGAELGISASFDDHCELADPPLVKTPTPLIDDDESRSGSEFHSPSPPSTPSPTLSPILVSLSELSQMPKESLELLQVPSSHSLSTDTIASHSSSLNGEAAPEFMITCSSHDDLRACVSAEECDRNVGSQISIQPKWNAVQPVKCRDDHDIIDKATVRRSADALKSYRNAVLSRLDSSRLDQIAPDREVQKHSSFKSVATKLNTAFLNKDESPRRFQFDFATSHDKNEGRRYTRSDFDGNDDYQRTWHGAATLRIDDADNNTVSKDGTTTISSGVSPRESDEVAILREQRNTYRDMSLTLGAEVAKLKNVLAAQKSIVHPFMGIQSGDSYQTFRNADVFDPSSIPRVFQIAPRARTLAALSDAGYRGEQESHASEDETGQRMSTGENIGITTSDVSIGYNSITPLDHMQLGLQMSKIKHDVLSPNAMHSRLARDIFQFMERNSSQLRQLDSKVQAAIERMNRLVKTVWPRAQVKLFGSHVTGLSVVTSDLDFVVCLPAVHKNAVAVAPGALEGRNAINETSQKLLARRLKGESWIDPRSMKLIDRTAVPVIKVATKDSKKYTLHLDISFDGPGHHGLDAAQMISSIMNELPLLRPLVVVLKQFLIERSLLEAYTGGISSYGLSLMVARYLQEQSPGADVGSLLMGFLDFYGNYFDPRSTGISVRKRQYFARPNYYASRNQGETSMWGPMMGYQAVQIRRNSLSDKETTNIKSGRPTLHHQGHGTQQQLMPLQVPFQNSLPDERNLFDNGMPYTFDPLFIEDPLSAGNNVGRNAFRIFQVQRAFSDAHCALLAALEWDEEGSDVQAAVSSDVVPSNTLETLFPLLKCLLRSGDDVFDL